MASVAMWKLCFVSSVAVLCTVRSSHCTTQPDRDSRRWYTDVMKECQTGVSVTAQKQWLQSLAVLSEAPAASVGQKYASSCKYTKN